MRSVAIVWARLMTQNHHLPLAAAYTLNIQLTQLSTCSDHLHPIFQKPTTMVLTHQLHLLPPVDHLAMLRHTMAARTTTSLMSNQSAGPRYLILDNLTRYHAQENRLLSQRILTGQGLRGKVLKKTALFLLTLRVVLHAD